MNAGPKAVIGHVFGWCIIVAFVVLLTLIFNFLGTIICAALAGMMMGSARLSRWYCLLVSLIFPGVISTVLRLSRAELADKQVLILSLLCFGIFWVICLTMSAMLRQEKVSSERADSPADRGVRIERSQPVEVEELTLAALEGIWMAKQPGQTTKGCDRVLEIEGGTAVLRTFKPDGGAGSRALGRLVLTEAGSEPQSLKGARATLTAEFII